MNTAQEFLIDLAVKSGILLGLALLATSVLRERHAALRHLVLTSAFAACLILPFAQAFIRPKVVATPILVSEIKGFASVPTPRRVDTPIPTKAAPERLPTGALVESIWFAGALSCLLFWVAGRARASALFRAAQPFEAADGSKSIRVARGDYPATAVTWGVFHPAVLLPASSVGWSDRELQSALDHELAHVKRRDDLAHTLGWLAVSVNWFNPLFWVALRAQRLSAELAADAVVGAARKAPADYAQDLLSIASKAALSRFPSAFGVTMLNSTNIEYRIKAILAGRTPSRIGALTLVTILATASFAVAAIGPLHLKGTLASSGQTGLEGIEHLSSQELALGHSSNVERGRPKLLFFGDFECPSCRKVAPALLQVKNSGYGVTFFHFPLKQHAHARLAAQAMIAAAKQGAEWKAYDALFTMSLSDRSIRNLGNTLGIDESRFAADLDSDSTKQRVDESFALCFRLKLTQVPSFFKLDSDGRAVRLDADAVRALSRASAPK